VSAVDVRAALAATSFLGNRTPTTPPGDEAAAFARLADYRDGAIFVGSFAGTSSWERHPAADEILMVLSGSVTVELLGGPPLQIREGGLAVVEKNRWHQLRAVEAVTLMTVTPLPTETSVQRPGGQS
jgi:mannose-6-phosphate isomerase-like protein (cupin superfamily)